MEGVKLEEHYRETLKKLGEEGGMRGLIFRKSQNKIQDPAKLRRLVVDLIGNESWLEMTADVKGDAYEGLLERNAQDVKGGAGQYFTRKYVAQGRAEGKAEGSAHAVLAVLAARGIVIPTEVRARIAGCTDLARLDVWLARAATATSAADLGE